MRYLILALLASIALACAGCSSIRPDPSTSTEIFAPRDTTKAGLNVHVPTAANPWMAFGGLAIAAAGGINLGESLGLKGEEAWRPQVTNGLLVLGGLSLAVGSVLWPSAPSDSSGAP